MGKRRSGGGWRRTEDVAEQLMRQGAPPEKVRARLAGLSDADFERARRRAFGEPQLPQEALERAGKARGPGRGNTEEP